MRATVAQIQRCKPDLGLPGNAGDTLTVFTVVNQLQILLQDLEKVRPSVDQSQDFQACSNSSVSVESPGSVRPAASESGPVQSSDSGAGELFFSSLRILPPGG